MDETPFDLLALPHTALQKCLKAMTPQQLLVFSRTSESSKNFIKNCHFNIELKEADRSEFFVNCFVDGRRDIIEIGPPMVRMEEREWMNAVTEISTLFRHSFLHLLVESRNFENTWKWIHNEQSEVKNLELIVIETEDPRRTIATILDNSGLEKMEKFTLQLNIADDFQYTDPFIFKRPPKRLAIQNAWWFTAQNLIDCEAEKIRLEEPQLTDEDLNLILKNWIGQVESLRSLESIKITCERNYNFDFNVVLDGLNRENEPRNVGPTIAELTFDDQFYIEVYKDPGFLVMLTLRKMERSFDSNHSEYDSDSH